MGNQKQSLKKSILLIAVIVINVMLMSEQVKQLDAMNNIPEELEIKNPVPAYKIGFRRIRNGILLSYFDGRLYIYDITNNAKPIRLGKINLESNVYSGIIHKNLLFLVIEDGDNFAIVWYDITKVSEIKFLGKKSFALDYYLKNYQMVVLEENNDVVLVINIETEFYMLRVNLDNGSGTLTWKEATITHKGLALNCSVWFEIFTQRNEELFVTFRLNENSTLGIAQLQYFIGKNPCFELLGLFADNDTDYPGELYMRNNLVFNLCRNRSGYCGLTVYNISTMNKLNQIYSYKEFEIARRVAVTNELVFAFNDRTISVYNLTTENNTEIIGKYSCPKTSSGTGNFETITEYTSFLYLSQATTNNDKDRYCVVDARTPSDLTLVGAFGIYYPKLIDYIFYGVMSGITVIIIIFSSLLLSRFVKRKKIEREQKNNSTS